MEGVYNMFNFGFGGPKSEADPQGTWTSGPGQQQPHQPAQQSLRRLLQATASQVIFNVETNLNQMLLPQELQQQQPYVYSPTTHGELPLFISNNH